MKNQEIIAELKATLKRANKRDSIAYERGMHTTEQMEEIEHDLRLIETSTKLIKMLS